ncbi:MAG: ABC transporter substrate-binding protein [Oscillospiraceae bacterium]
MKVKHFLAFAAAAIMLLPAFTACEEQPPEKEKTTLTFAYTYDAASSSDLLRETIEKALDDFNRDNSQTFRIEMEAITTRFDEIAPYFDELNKLAASNQLPDLVWMPDGAVMKEYADAGRLVDLTSYLEEDDAWRESFWDGAFVSTAHDGGIFAVPLCLRLNCLFYNTELFAKAGVKAEGIQTWEDFLNACQVLKGTGVQPLAMGGMEPESISYFTDYLVQRLGGVEPMQQIVDGADGFRFDQDCFIQAGQMTYELLQKGYLPPDTAFIKLDEAGAYFRNGEAAMFCIGSWAVGGFHRDDSQIVDKVGVIPFPLVEGGKGKANHWFVETNANIAVSAQSEHAGQAVQWLKYLTSDSVQAMMAEEGYQFPATNAAFQADLAPKEYTFVWEILERDGMTASGFFDYVLDEAMGKAYQETLRRILIGTDSSEAFQNLQAQAEEHLALELAEEYME